MSSDRENGGPLLLNTGRGACSKAVRAAAPPPLPPPFRFGPPRALIDWRALHSLDLGRVVRETDVDALEGVLDVLSPANTIQLFRAAQLTVNYLLHVQDRLAADGAAALAELAKVQQRTQLLGLRVREAKEELAGSRKEVRHLKKALRTLEAVALSRQAQPEVRLLERVVEKEVPDAAALRALEARLVAAEAERHELQRDNSKLTDALAAATAGVQASAAAAAEAARWEERQAAEERLHAALEEERHRQQQQQQQQQSKAPRLSVVVAGDEGSPNMRSQLAAAQRREREADRRAEAAEAEAAQLVAACKRVTTPTAEARRLRAQLEAAEAEAEMLRSQLAARERERSPVRRQLSGSGLGAHLEDDLHDLQADLQAAEAARSRLSQRCQQLERQLQEAQQRQQAAGGSAATPEAEVLQREVERLRSEKIALQEECRRLRQQAAAGAAEIEHLRHRLGQPAGGGSRPHSGASSPVKAGGRTTPPPPEQQQPEPGAERGGIGSPIEEPGSGGGSPADAAGAVPSPTKRPPTAGGRLGSSSPPQRPASALGSPTRGHAPTAEEQQQFRRELQHSLATAERPGVVSRFPHSLGSFLALRSDLQGELEAELREEMRGYGIDPSADRLTSAQLSSAMAELERRRAVARADMTLADQQRHDYMRATVAWHVERMAGIASGQRKPSPAAQPLLAQPPPGLRPIRTASQDAELSPRRRGFVEQVLDQVGDEAAVYSPLARGASALSDHHGHQGASPAPSTGALASEEGGTASSSPWLSSRDRAFNATLEAEGRRSPLAHTASSRGWEAQGAASPTQHYPRAQRSVQFVAKEGYGSGSSVLNSSAGGGGSGEWGVAAGTAQSLAPAQRMGRRPAHAYGM
ncbi:zinc finger DZIP1L isoform B [Micractinium conductrix]|uniref:Zinc finger DZIP1L isoform B n=1 Tax=Micractinium conductrix TaxID=554055 RepID=A0A2P6VN65_9CHLO|nr:zinc finger DZIP1L isoform B [Micractinium conductrix]|eukprot:PSC75497.1 zinc finger DZIP1L isoform B [Micractinium conductrix]